MTIATYPKDLSMINSYHRPPISGRMAGITQSRGIDMPCLQLVTIDTGAQHLSVVNAYGYPGI